MTSFQRAVVSLVVASMILILGCSSDISDSFWTVQILVVKSTDSEPVYGSRISTQLTSGGNPLDFSIRGVTDSTGSFSYGGFGPSVAEDHIARIEADGFIGVEYLLPDAAEKVHTGFWRLTVALEQTDAG